MYWGISPSRISRAAVYAAFPPVGVGLVPVAGLGDAKPLLTPVAELSSQYCSQRSLSRISAAARKLRIAASPSLNLPFSRSSPKAETPLIRNPLLRVAAPAATTPRFKNERRPTSFCVLTFIAPPFAASFAFGAVWTRDIGRPVPR